jgi:hypothetical protein
VTGSISGILDVRLRGNLGREWNGGGVINLTRGNVAGLDVKEWRLPVTFALAPSSGNVEVNIEDSSGQVAEGRVSGRAWLRLRTTNRIDGRLIFYDVNVAALLRRVSERSQIGTGRHTGDDVFQYVLRTHARKQRKSAMNLLDLFPPLKKSDERRFLGIQLAGR